VRARSWLPWVALAAVLVVALVALVVRSQPSDSVSARSARLAKLVKCPDCQGESVANSNVEIARNIRALITRRVAAGQSDDQVLAYIDTLYPDSRISPSGNGIDMLAWAIPAAAIVAALGGIGLALRRWSRQPRLAASSADEQLVAHARSDLEGTP
jgi:cytochrome c-type biogenesis protein CcmH